MSRDVVYLHGVVFAVGADGVRGACGRADAGSETEPAMYSYVANWQFPRASFSDVDKMLAGGNPALDKAYADGRLSATDTTRTGAHAGQRHPRYVVVGDIDCRLMKALSAVSATDMPNSRS